MKNWDEVKVGGLKKRVGAKKSGNVEELGELRGGGFMDATHRTSLSTIATLDQLRLVLARTKES